MLIAIDHGNYAVKTPHFSFISGLTEHTVKPPMAEEVLEYNGKYWSLTGQRLPYMRDKTRDDRYFILSLFAIAKELSSAGTNTAFEQIDLAVGLPPEHYGMLRERFAQYFRRFGTVNFAYNNRPMSIVIRNVFVYPQAILKHKGIIANPNCSTIIMVMALKPIYDLAKIKRVIVSTYQAVSGAGKEGIDELDAQVREHSEGREMTANILPSASAEKHYPIAFNLIPQIDVFCDNLYTKEEMKMVNETKKIMEDYEMRITATTIRVPVYRSHSESVNIELEKEVDLGAMREALAKFPGVTVQDDPSKQEYPMPLYTSEKDDVYVGRLRRDESCEKSYNMWVVGDQIRKGAALNTLQIAETMIKNGWI